MKNPLKITYLLTGITLETINLISDIRKKEALSHSRTSKIIVAEYQHRNSTLTDCLKNLKCQVTSRDICSISLKQNTSRSTLYRYILLSNNYEKNTRDALQLTKHNKERFHLEIYSLSPNTGSELLFDSIDKGSANAIVPPVKIRRIHLERNLIYNILYQNSLFDFATINHGEKWIKIVIIGLDSYGIEMLKACLWCGQMDGYVLKIYIIDSDEKCAEKFYYYAPEIAIRNKVPRAGDDYYEIEFWGGIQPNTEIFIHKLQQINHPSWVFISYGEDNLNLEIGIKIREIYAKQSLSENKAPIHYSTTKQFPRIQTVIRNNDTADLLNTNQLINYCNQTYNIEAVGSSKSVYTLTNICNDDLEAIALQSHLHWGDENSFQNHEYFRRASLSSAIHKKYRDALYPEDNELKNILEHRRWNAYLRGTEGYTFGYIRDNLAKQHNCLVKYNDLANVDKNKDKKMNNNM